VETKIQNYDGLKTQVGGLLLIKDARRYYGIATLCPHRPCEQRRTLPLVLACNSLNTEKRRKKHE